MRATGYALLLLLAGAVPVWAQSDAPADPFAAAPSDPAPVAAPGAAPPAPAACCRDGIRETPSADSTQTLTPLPADPPAPIATSPIATSPITTLPVATPSADAPPTATPPAATPPATTPVAAPPADTPPEPPTRVAEPAPPVIVTAPAEAPLPPAESEAVAVDHPTLVDTATLQDAGRMLRLFGVVGLQGTPADGLKGYIAGAGDKVTCQPHAAEYVCMLADGTDIALVALVNGAAQARADAPDAYRAEEGEAQAARRGVWSSLPPPPTAVAHPTVPDTATLLAEQQSYSLDGIEGLAGEYATSLKGYLAANGDSLLCQPQSSPGHFVCLLPDGTDIAKVALVNGAARVAADAPDGYRVQQADAIANRRGIWRDATPAQLALVPPPPPVLLVPPEPADGLVYIGGAPTAVIDGATVFFAYADGAGWGYWDHDRHWRSAPDDYGAHLNRYHPEGSGLRGGGFAGQPGPGRAGIGHAGLALSGASSAGAAPVGPRGRALAAGAGVAPHAGGPAFGQGGLPSARTASGAVAHPAMPSRSAAAPAQFNHAAMPARPQAPARFAAGAPPAAFVHPTHPTANAFARPASIARAAPMAHAAPARVCKPHC